MKKMFTFLALVLAVAWGTVSADGEMVQELDKGSIDWSHLVIYATGIGAPNPNMPQGTQRPITKRAAMQDAYRNLLEIVQGVNITSETTVENFMLKDDVIRSKVEGLIKNFKEDKVKYMSDGTIEVTIKMVVTGELAKTLLPLYGQQKEIPVVSGSVSDTEKAIEYTGLIIDARNFTVLPCMAPKVFNDDNTPIYDASYVDADYAVKMGVVGYSKDVENAKRDERVVGNPLVIVASKTASNSMDIYINGADAVKVTNNVKLLEAVKKCKVMFVIK